MSEAGRSRTLVVSYLGAVVHRMGSWMPIAGTVELLGQVGLDAPSVRTAVFRLKKRGWLASESRHGVRGYALTPLAERSLSEGDEIIWTPRLPADLADGWCIVNFSIPEAERSRRHQLRAHLTSLGFGNPGTAMWIAPARMQAAAEQAVAELGLDKYTSIFVGHYAGRQDLSSLIYDSWDLGEINDRYRDFVSRYAAQAGERGGGALDPGPAFATYLRAIDDWRKLPFRDPGLPREVLAEDWSQPEASDTFSALVARLERPALAHAARRWPGDRG